MKEMKFYTQEEIEDELIGKRGTPERDRYEEQLDLFLIGEAIKQLSLIHISEPTRH